MAGIGDVKDGKVKQEEVFKRVRQAAGLLRSAADMENAIESERIRRLDRHADDFSDLNRDPMEERLRTILEKLDEYGYV